MIYSTLTPGANPIKLITPPLELFYSHHLDNVDWTHNDQ
jgi:hypothetical protein